MDYVCHRCGLKTKFLSNLRKHLHNKKPCPPNLQDIDRHEVFLAYEKNDIHTKQFDCRHCDKSFSHQSSRSFHEGRCKLKNQNDTLGLKKELLELKKEIQILKSSKLGSSSQHIITQNNITQNTINNNIVINAYGSDKPLLTFEQLTKLLSKGARKAIETLIIENNFNINKPENMNYFISNYKDNIGRVYDGQVWAMKHAEELAHEVFEKYRSVIDDMVDELMYQDDDDDEIAEKKNIFMNKIGSLIDRWVTKNDKTHFEEGMRIVQIRS